MVDICVPLYCTSPQDGVYQIYTYTVAKRNTLNECRGRSFNNVFVIVSLISVKKIIFWNTFLYVFMGY